MTATYDYWIGPPPWVADEALAGGGCYAPPAGCAGWIDLRSVTECATGGHAVGAGLFAISVGTHIPAGMTLLGTGYIANVSVSGPARDAWEAATGFRPAGVTLAELLADQLTSGSDPSGQSAVAPLMPDEAGDLAIHLDGHSCIWRRKLEGTADPHWSKVKAVLQRDLLAVRDDALAGKLGRRVKDRQFHRRVALATMEKLAQCGITNWEDVRPAGWTKAESPLPHETVLTESFTAANGTAPDAGGLDQTWTVYLAANGTASVQSNQLKNASSASGARNHGYVGSDLSSADHYAQCDVYNRGSGAGASTMVGPIIRKAANTTDTHYHFGAFPGSATGRLWKSVAATYTQLGSDASITISLPQQAKVSASGSTITGFWAGSQVVQVTDTAITGNLRTGWRLVNTGTQGIIDNWEAGDLVTGGPFPHYTRRQMTGGMLALSGGLR